MVVKRACMAGVCDNGEAWAQLRLELVDILSFFGGELCV